MVDRITNIIQTYEKSNEETKSRFPSFFNKNEHLGFWNRWTQLHISVLKGFDASHPLADENMFERISMIFLKKRFAMFSAVSQGMRNSFVSDKITDEFFEIIACHDKVFKELLNELKTHFSEELKKINRSRKILSAYQANQTY